MNKWVFYYYFFFCRSGEEFNYFSPMIPREGILSIKVSLTKVNWFIGCFPLITYSIRAQVTSLIHIAVDLHCTWEFYVFTHSLCVILKMMDNVLVFSLFFFN